MKTIIHMNRHIIAANRKHGADDPPLTVKTYKSSQRGHEVKIDGPSTCVYSPEKPLKCGATAWIETQSPVTVLTRPQVSDTVDKAHD